MEKVTEGLRKLHIEGLYLYFCLPNIWGDQIKYHYMGRTRNTRLRIKEYGQYLSENTERYDHLQGEGAGENVTLQRVLGT